MRTRLPLITAIILLFAFTKGENYMYASETQSQIVMQQPAGKTVQMSEAAWEVIQANNVTRENQMSGVVDVASVFAVTAEEVRAKIDSYFIPDAAIYLDGVLRSEGDLDHIINRRNISALVNPVELRYGVLIKNTALRTYPSWQKLSAEVETNAADYFQKSLLLIGEGIVVLHQTEDKIWSFVQSNNAFGWVETANIAFCRREEMDAFSNSESFVIFTEENLLVGTQEFRMGTKLPLSRLEEGCVVIWLPASNDNGNLYQTEFRLNKEAGLHIGNIELSVDNVMQQAYKLINVGYGRGDMNGMIDAGSMLSSIYRCFGIVLPRETDQMIYTGVSITDISAMEREAKRAFIIEQGAGCILQMADHAVLYLGLSIEGKPVILNSTETYSLDSVNIAEPYKCVVTPLETYTEDGQNYLDSYQYLIDFNLPD